MTQQHPLVGVGVIIVRDGRVLLGQRKGSHGAGTWALPGGHLEFGETIEQCAAREVLEETGLQLQDATKATYSNDVFEDKHYVTLFVVSSDVLGEPAVMEPEKCAQWDWFHWHELPSPLFAPLASIHAAGYVPHGCVDDRVTAGRICD